MPRILEQPSASRDGAIAVTGNTPPLVVPPQPTGRRMIMFQQGVPQTDIAKMLAEATGGEAVAISEIGSVSAALRMAGAADAPLVLRRSPIAVIGGGARQAASAAVALSARDEVVDTRPEFWMFAGNGPPWGDRAESTWGVDATGAFGSAYDGSGIKIAILDTGIDLGHPDFAGRVIVTTSCVPTQTVDDVHGHGTHCAGTAASSYRGGGNLPRYGVAPGAHLHVAKVLDNGGNGREMDIVAGIEWAMDQGCEVISMSLERPTSPTEGPDPFYETVTQNALAAGCLIVAAAGNQSDRRFNYIAPVSAPASSPAVLAVASIGSDGGIASTSCGATGTGAVDLCAPGISILSSVPRPQLYRKMNGTSMACPHVAGIAALWAQSDPGLRGQALWDALVGSVRPVGGLGARDVGAGLVTAP